MALGRLVTRLCSVHQPLQVRGKSLQLDSTHLWSLSQLSPESNTLQVTGSRNPSFLKVLSSERWLSAGAGCQIPEVSGRHRQVHGPLSEHINLNPEKSGCKSHKWPCLSTACPTPENHQKPALWAICTRTRPAGSQARRQP